MERGTMGALVIESVALKAGASAEPVTLRVADRLALHEGVDPHIIPLLNHALAAGPAPDLVHASIEFILDGSAYFWRADFDMNSYELTNRSTNHTLMGIDKIVEHLDRILPQDGRVREASFGVPDGAVSEADPGDYRTENPPASDELIAELALCESRLSKANRASLTATALYSELFSMLESMESFSDDLQSKITQLNRHAEAEAACAELEKLESELRKQTEAGRQARLLEKEIAEYAEEIKDLDVIEDRVIQRAQEVSTEVDSNRRLFLEAEQLKKQIHGRVTHIKPMRGWVAGALGAMVVIAALQWKGMIPFAGYVLGSGVALMIAWPWAILQTVRRASLRRVQKTCGEKWTQRRMDLEVSELSLLQLLRPHSARDIVHLKHSARGQVEALARLESMSSKLVDLRAISKTDDAISRHSAAEAAVLADAQALCRRLAPYQMEPSARETVVKQVEDMEMEAKARQQAAGELKEQCEMLQSGWSDVSVLAEKVSKLKIRLSEWRRWDKAFRALHEVIDRLPGVSDALATEDDSQVAVYLKRISAGRWSQIQYDSDRKAYRVFDHDADLWIRADPDNPTVISSVNLACRLGMLDLLPQSSRMPLWLVEPFDELPEAMATATAALLAEVSLGRQVVMLCRRVPRVAWPAGVMPQT